MLPFAFLSALLASGLSLTSALPIGMSDVDEHSQFKRQASTVNTCYIDGSYAITFDDGPYQWTADVAGQLNDYGAKGTFFINGNNYGCIYNYAEQLQFAYSSGHVIGSHSWGHENIAELSDQALEENLDRLEEAFRKILNVKPALFRPPYGSYTQANLDVLARRGYTTVLWDMDTGDSGGASVEQSQGEYDRVANLYSQPGVSLQHETYDTTVWNVLPYALGRMSGAGFWLTDVAQCAYLSPYQEVYGDLPSRDDTWYC